MKMINQDTICAIATAQGGAIGIIRVSGPRAIEITSHLFIPVQGKPLTERKPYTLTSEKSFLHKEKLSTKYWFLYSVPPILIPVKTAQKSCVMVHPIFYNK